MARRIGLPSGPVLVRRDQSFWRFTLLPTKRPGQVHPSSFSFIKCHRLGEEPHHREHPGVPGTKLFPDSWGTIPPALTDGAPTTVSTKTIDERDGRSVIAQVLKAAGERPDASSSQSEKNQYAIKFADAMGAALAADLAPRMQGITASAKKSAKAVRGTKQLDVNFSTPATGLALGISLKSVHIRESGGAKRYTHNLKRNEEELRIESSGYHRRQPYAVMIGVLFLPFDACDDAKRDNASSFGSWVRHLRPYGGRAGPKDDEDRFEKIYLGLYEPDGSDLRFFDVETDPPKASRPRTDGPLLDQNGRPRRLLSYGEFLDAVHHAFLKRNSAEFRWADGTEDPLTPAERSSVDDED